MKKIIYLFLASAIVFSVASCGNKDEKKDEKKDEAKKVETFDQLFDKYDGIVFEDCDAFIAAGDEMLDILVITVDKAYDGDEEAEEDFSEMIDFMGQFDDQVEGFKEDCPEKMDKFDTKAEEQMEPIMSKLMELSFRSMATEDESVLEEMEDELTSGLEELEEAAEDNTIRR